MSKLTMGRTRKKTKTEEIGSLYIPRARTKAADAVFVFGAAAVCVMLVLPMLPEEHMSPCAETAVMVMSEAVQEHSTAGTSGREELVTPSNTEFDEKWNFYDYIGELFAGLISGQG